jgi:lipopolysaccharide/colanic/teichoic acid biosynthesis glycosyltransferase
MFQIGKYRSERRIIRRSISSFQSFSKRGFDILIAIAGLLLLSPLISLISLGIRIESPGPALCRHKRYSSNNVEFEIFEFRTSLVQRGKTCSHGLDEIQYITGFGQILRRSGMNKLPQLMNVLRGEMSIVGTHLFTNAPGRPFPPLDLHEVRPGLVTCAHDHDEQCRIAGTARSIDRRINCDRYYIENSSFFFDMKVLLHTLLSKTTYFMEPEV